MKEIKIGSKRVYEHKFLSVDEDLVKLPNDVTSTRVVLRHPGGAAVLPITKDQKILLIKQFRYPINQELIEIPAGKLDPNESSLVCAMRELEEETSYISNHFEFLMSIHPCVGYSDEVIDLFIAYDCEKINYPKSMDDDEFIEVKAYTLDDIEYLLNNHQITDGKTLIACEHYLRKIRLQTIK
ncbi:MAG: NUDIX hydrolase [Acholeplasmataceae bacterium]|nr:NUDIX hydrolase [Acholeplasmataceae bacterium]